jgi:ADP-ribose pyrophosphatase YjhB (NUDIX family)
VRSWVVAAALIEGADGVLLVQNRRRDGSLDWSPPGGVIEVHDGEAVLDGLTREVAEETGLLVTAWEGPVYEVEVTAEGLGWMLEVEVYRAGAFHGELVVNDPDGIVVDARFVAVDAWAEHLAAAHPWVREPVLAWAERVGLAAAEAGRLGGDRPSVAVKRFRYRVDGRPPAVEVVRLPDVNDG